MNLSKLLDLRFVIGVFFALVGGLLLVHSFLVTTTPVEGAGSINRWAGGVFALFGVGMIALSFKKEAHDELLEEPKD